MAIASARFETVKLPLALLLYLVGTWIPILISAGLMALWAVITGQSLPILPLCLFLVVLRQFNVFTLSTLYHRSYSHRQFKYHPVVEHVLRFWNWLWMGTGGRSWAIMHRWHHAAADTEGDPHSPTKLGGSVWNVTAQTFRSYQRCLHHPEEFERYARYLPNDRFERAVRWLESRGIWGLLVVRLPLLIGLLTLFMPLPAAILIMPGVVGSVWFSTVIVVNGLCHTMGYRTANSGDSSTNLFPVDLIGWGEALHHNHHHRPGRANLARARWEFDPGFAVLFCLSKVGIVRQLRA
jgi:stearoyl-CoA desaturase (delta-9 desaturase)